ncbi:MAG: hypothetical protein WCK02_04305 [Bacteroidota bacterium]
MKKTIFFYLLALIIITSIITFNSCKKAEREELKDVSVDNSVAEGIFDDVFRQVNNGYDEALNSKKSTNSGCALVTILPADTGTYPKTLTIDFGTGCTDGKAVTRKGKIIAVFSGKYRTPGTLITISLVDYQRDDKKITGTKTISNDGFNGNGNLEFTIKVTNAAIITDEGTITWTSTRKREWIAGYTTPWPTLLDDEYLVTGTASGTSAKGKNFTINITEALKVNLDCKWITSGKIEIKPDGIDPRILDFGAGDCDDNATLTIKNKTYDIRLGY